MGVGGGVQRIEMTERETPVFGGAQFGAVGTYERLDGGFSGDKLERPGLQRLLADIRAGRIRGRAQIERAYVVARIIPEHREGDDLGNARLS